MTTVITTPTGNIGRTLTSLLLDAGLDLRLLVRDRTKVEDFASRGAEVCEGSLDDEDFVGEATEGAEQLFWVTPPDLTAEDYRERQNEFGRVAAAAVSRQAIGRVIHLSSLGAQEGQGNGPIGGLHDNEARLEAVADHLLHLRPAFFMENLLALVPMIATQKTILQPMPADHPLAMVATRDIARVAADEILDPTWTGHRIRGVHGPGDFTWTEVAEVVSRVMGEEVTYVPVPGDAVRQALAAVEIPSSTAALYVEMLEGFGSGRIRSAEPRDQMTTTPTSLETFVSDTLFPAVAAFTGF